MIPTWVALLSPTTWMSVADVDVGHLHDFQTNPALSLVLRCCMDESLLVLMLSLFIVADATTALLFLLLLLLLMMRFRRCFNTSPSLH